MARKKQTFIWKYFENYEDEGLAICKTCNNKLKNNRISNLKAHLLKVHKIDVQCEIEPSDTISLNSSNISRKKTFKIELNKKMLLKSYIGLVTEDCIPLNVLNSPNMRNILDPICEGLKAKDGKEMCLNAANCEKSLQLVANNIRTDINSEVKNKLISLKIDSATRLCPNIFAMSAQFIKDGKIKSHILGTVELKGNRTSTAKNIAIEIIEILKKYDITLNQIISVTSDNGANMIKATNILSFDSEEDIEENEVDCANDEYLKKIELEEKTPEMLLGNIQVSRCAAHTAQLCALDVIKSPDIIKHLLTCRNLTKYIRKTSNGYREIFELKQLKMPQLDCPTRWGSTFTMIENLKQAKSELMKIKSVRNKSRDENFKIDSSFWDFIDSYCVVFIPLQKTIQKFQKEQLHYGDFYAQWLICKICTQKTTVDAKNVLTTTIGNKILQAMEKRTNTLMHNKNLIACLYLDPRFHHTLTALQKIDATKYLKTIWDRLNEINPGGTACLTSNSMVNPSTNVFIKIEDEDEDELLDEFLAKDIAGNDITTKIVNIQIPFQRSDTDVLTYWKGKQYTDQELHALSDVLFAIPSTQVSIERAFSTLKLVLTRYGNRQSQEALENILLVKLNPSFLEAAIDTYPLFQEQDDDESS